MVPSVERSILNPLSFMELSAQERLIPLDETSAAFKLDGLAGIGVGVAVGVAVAVGVGVALGVGVGAGVGVDIEEAAPYNDWAPAMSSTESV